MSKYNYENLSFKYLMSAGINPQSLLQAQMKPLTQKLTKTEGLKTDYTMRITGYTKLKSSVSQLESATKGLMDRNKLSSVEAKSSNEDVSVSVNSLAKPQNMQIKVSQLAQAQKIKSPVFEGDPNKNIVAQASPPGSTIKLSFAFGAVTPKEDGTNDAQFSLNPSKPKQVVEIPDNATLNDIKNAINQANEKDKTGVRADLMRDASGGYSLVLSSTDTGKMNGLRIEVSGADGEINGLAYKPEVGASFDMVQKPPTLIKPPVDLTKPIPSTEVTAGLDAEFEIDGIFTTSSKNTIKDIYPGVTVTLNSLTEKDKLSRISITQNTSGTKDTLTKMIESYNEVQKMIKDLTSFDADNPDKSGTMRKELNYLRKVQSELKGALSGFQGNGAVNNLADIGIKTNSKTGFLELDDKKFENIMKTNSDDVVNFLSYKGSSTTGEQIQVVGASSSTQQGTFQVIVKDLMNATHVGTQGLFSSFPLGTNPTSSDVLSFKINECDEAITIDLSTLNVNGSSKDFRESLQNAINNYQLSSGAKLKDLGHTVSASIDRNGSLILASSREGKTSQLNILSDCNFLGLTSGNKQGSDNISGEFIFTDLDGNTSTVGALGNGNILTGGSANNNPSSGLQISISSTGLGDQGSIEFKPGIAYKLSAILKDMLADGKKTDKKGIFETRIEDMTAKGKAVDKKITALQRSFETTQEKFITRLLDQESKMAEMFRQQEFMQQQMASFNAMLFR
jgi:flagellar hook-associated protein 2